MKLVFLEVDTERSWALASVGPAYIASYLRRHGHDCEMLRLELGVELEEILHRVRSARPDLLGLSLTTRQWRRAASIVGELRRHLDVPVVAGGLHPTFSPQEVLAQPGFDYVCLGEGEEASLDLLNWLATVPSGSRPAMPCIDNIWPRGGPRPKLRPPIDPPDALPFLARDHLDEPTGIVHLNTQRGCPFPCTYCAARNYHDLYRGQGSYGRRRSHDNVLAELTAVQSQMDVSYIVFLDDTFTLNRRWLSEFCRRYGKRFGLPFSINARAETVDRSLLMELADAGCRHVIFGVESGSERLRREVMKRPISNQQFANAFRWSREAGLLITANYMLGLPEETPDDLASTFDLHRRLQPDDFGYFVFYPYPGTQLFQLCRQRGYLDDDYLDQPANHRRSILQMPNLTPQDIAMAYDRFTEERDRQYRTHYGGDEDEAVTQRHIQGCAATG